MIRSALLAVTILAGLAAPAAQMPSPSEQQRPPALRPPTRATELKYVREINAVFIGCPHGVRSGREYEITFHYVSVVKQ